MRILIVCLGNVCRSPVAERLLRLRLDKAGLGERYVVESAGVTAMVGRPIHPDAADQLARLGGDPDGFTARQLRAAQVEQADLVLTATTDVRRRVLEEAPRALRRTFTLREFAALASGTDASVHGDPEALVADASHRRSQVSGIDLDIIDPMGRDEKVHARAAGLIDGAVKDIVTALQGD